MPATSSALPVWVLLLELEVTAMIEQLQKSGHLVNHLVTEHFKRASKAQQFF